MQHFYINPSIFENLENGNFEPIYFDCSKLWCERMFNMRKYSCIPNGKDIYGTDVFHVRLFNTNSTNQSLIAIVRHDVVKGKEMNGQIEFKNQRFNKLTVCKVENPTERDKYGRT